MIFETVSTSSDDTERLGQLLGSLLKSPEVIELRADLGGGKTTFVRGLARGLRSKDMVSSPTFTLNKIYKTKNLEIHHFDFYRLNDAGVVADQLAESLENPKVITVVEWSDIVQNVLPTDRLSIEFKMMPNSSEERKISISYRETQAKIIRQLETKWQKSQP
ncbi:tRNA (adenosine(37)-N6)-threonylcarbamoyltransferase complex ATPase subunit type 1 TsaE [bacterium G20]|nr:tRNA (adenosine(37)-N6)-threonylcarbamoyltransferase complex ATPase subunit type 1 TsaE [bacterium G20]